MLRIVSIATARVLAIPVCDGAFRADSEGVVTAVVGIVMVAFEGWQEECRCNCLR